MKNYLKKYKLRFILIALVIIFRQLLLVSAQQLNAKMFDELVVKNIQGFVLITIAIIIVWVLVTSLDALLHIKEENVTLDIEQNIREDVSNKMILSDYNVMQAKSNGNYLSWLNNDITVISQKGIVQFFNIVRDVSGVVFASIAMFQYHWSLLVITFIGFICMFYVPKIFDKRIYEMSKAVSKENEQFVAELEDQLNGYSVYFAFSALIQFVNKIKLASEALKKVLMRQVRLDAAIIAVNFSVNVFFQILLTFIGALCYFNGWVQIGAVAIVGSFADIIFSGLGNISYQFTSMKSVKPIFDKYETLYPEDFTMQELDNNTLYAADNLSLIYNDEVIFNELTFTIYPNNKCLISGLSGSGKSSLVKMLLGYYKDFRGNMYYKGHDIKGLSSKRIAQDVIYLSQQSYVFHGTVKENVLLGEFFEDKQLIETLSLIGFESAESILNANANELSGGQKQRIALARALIRKPKVLICDEITSALDKKSSSEIEELLLSQKNLTVIMITHVLQSQRELFDVIIEL